MRNLSRRYFVSQWPVAVAFLMSAVSVRYPNVRHLLFPVLLYAVTDVRPSSEFRDELANAPYFRQVQKFFGGWIWQSLRFVICAAAFLGALSVTLQ